jgi:hypothetical protein
MTLAIILVTAAAVALIVILKFSVSRSMQISRGSSLTVQPLDVEAFRNLINAAERDYLRRYLPAAEFRVVQRERLRATAAYVQVAAQNAAVLIHIGQAALPCAEPQTVEAARQLVDNALLLRRNATYALLRIYVALAWPDATATGVAILDGYQQLSSSAMLLGRLQNPAAPVRISSTI